MTDSTSSTPDMPTTMYTVVEYADYRKEVYVAVQGFTPDKEKALAFAEKACKENGAKYSEPTHTQIAKNIHDANGFDDETYVDIEARAGGKPIARYRCYEFCTPNTEYILEEHYIGFEEGKSVITLRDYVLPLLDGEEKHFDAIAEKFDMTQVVGDHQTCSNMDLLIEVETFMILNNYGHARDELDYHVVSSVVFAVFEGKPLP